MNNTFNFDWQCTCGACPEQYDIYLNGKLVAYFRLRWGRITVSLYTDDGRKEIIAASYGDPSCGSLYMQDEFRIKRDVEKQILRVLVDDFFNDVDQQINKVEWERVS